MSVNGEIMGNIGSICYIISTARV